MIVDSRTEIADPDFCAKVREALRDPRRRGRRGGRRARRPHARLVGRRGQRGAGRAPLLRARRRRDGRLRLGARPRRRSARSTPSTASCSCCRRGRCGTCASTSRWRPATATTSTSACRPARPAARSSPPTCARSTTARSSSCPRPRDLGRGAHRPRREVGRPLARPRAARTDWKRRARRAEAEREAARTFAYSSANRLDAEVLALEREMAAMTDSPSWRLTAPLRWINRVRA